MTITGTTTTITTTTDAGHCTSGDKSLGRRNQSWLRLIFRPHRAAPPVLATRMQPAATLAEVIPRSERKSRGRKAPPPGAILSA